MMLLPLLLALASSSAQWTGADEKIVERMAEQRGRPAHPPLLPTGEGDLQLSAFLLAGAAGGFALGWLSKSLFGRPRAPSTKHES